MVLHSRLPATGALAQEEEGGEGGIPAYAVARVKVLDGSVWVRPSGGGEWEEFPSNSPLPPGSRVSVPEGSEAELQFHGGQFVLLTSGTDLEVRDLQEGESVFRLRAGEIRFDLPPDDFAPVSVRVPGGAIAQFPVPGRQWLTVTDSDETRLVVRRGSAVVTMEGDEHSLGAGDEAVVRGDPGFHGGTHFIALLSCPVPFRGPRFHLPGRLGREPVRRRLGKHRRRRRRRRPRDLLKLKAATLVSHGAGAFTACMSGW